MLNYRQLAEYLIKAEENNYAVTCITDEIPEFDLSNGYLVQDKLINIKKEKGHKIIAFKMGLTSHAKMKQMNINEPIYGTVFDYMQIPDKGKLLKGNLIHPKVEAEIAFIVDKDIKGPGVTAEEVLAKTKGIIPALEIIDSRYKNFKFKLPDVIADNTSASRVVFGNRVFDPNKFEMNSIGVSLSINGEFKAKDTTAAVLGNPVNSVALLANMLYNHGKGKIPKDSIILTGGITEAVLLNEGDSVISKFDGMGEVSFYVE